MKTIIISLLLGIPIVASPPALSKGEGSGKDFHQISGQKKQDNITSTDTLSWYTELCDHVGTFDTSKYTKKQLQDTYKLWFAYSSLALLTKDIETDADRYNTFDSKAQLKKLEAEYKAKKKELKGLALVNGKIWEELRQNRLKNMDECYELCKINLEAYSNPKVLLNNRFSKYCPEYAEVLASNDTLKLIACWGKLMSEQENRNFSETLFDRYTNSLSPESRVAHAKSYILAYGWHNCANRQINHDTPNVNYEGAFEKLFLSVETECEEP
jgi:hypothetical protein